MIRNIRIVLNVYVDLFSCGEELLNCFEDKGNSDMIMRFDNANRNAVGKAV